MKCDIIMCLFQGGSVAHLTREVLELVTDLQSQAVQIPLANSAQCHSSMKHFKDEISSFVGLKVSKHK